MPAAAKRQRSSMPGPYGRACPKTEDVAAAQLTTPDEFSSCRARHTHIRRRPEQTVLHQVVREHLETFLAETRLRGGGEGLPLITSNNEKELPDAFLRRCIFYYIDFPDVPLMRKIIDVHHPHLDTKLLDQVLIKFYWLREQSELARSRRLQSSSTGPARARWHCGGAEWYLGSMG